MRDKPLLKRCQLFTDIKARKSSELQKVVSIVSFEQSVNISEYFSKLINNLSSCESLLESVDTLIEEEKMLFFLLINNLGSAAFHCTNKLF